MKDKTVDILLVEDNWDDWELTRDALSEHVPVANVAHVRDGAEALDFIFCQGPFSSRDIANPPRVVLLDLKLPKIDGIEVLQHVKSDPRTRSIPIVVLTSSREQSDVDRCYELGVNSYLVKPVDFDEFTESIRHVGRYWLSLNETTYAYSRERTNGNTSPSTYR